MIRCTCGKTHRHPRIGPDGHVAPVIDALVVASDIPHMAAEVDRRWEPERASWTGTIGEGLRRLDEICWDVLRECGYTVGYGRR